MLLGNESLKALHIYFEQDFQKIIESADNSMITIQNMFEVPVGQHPRILKMFLKKEITFETLVILNLAIKGTFEYWNITIQETILWPEIQKNCLKYQPFLLKYIGSDKIPKFKDYIFKKSLLTVS